jgi:hypothetical protein
MNSSKKPSVYRLLTTKSDHNSIVKQVNLLPFTASKEGRYKLSNVLHKKITPLLKYNNYTNLFVINNPTFFHVLCRNTNAQEFASSLINLPIHIGNNGTTSLITKSNVLPNSKFNYTFFKKIYTTSNSKKLYLNFIPTYYNTIVRFMEYVSGSKVLVQFYPFINQSITTEWVIKYKL